MLKYFFPDEIVFPSDLSVARPELDWILCCPSFSFTGYSLVKLSSRYWVAIGQLRVTWCKHDFWLAVRCCCQAAVSDTSYTWLSLVEKWKHEFLLVEEPQQLMANVLYDDYNILEDISSNNMKRIGLIFYVEVSLIMKI